MKVRWLFMGNSPIDGSLRHIGDVDEFNEYQGTGLVKSGHCVVLPETAVVQESTRAEPSLIAGVNISEEELAEIEAARDAAADSIRTPVKAKAK